MSVPNILTSIRICLVPAFLIVYLPNQGKQIEYYAMAILVLAFLTDILDGFIARKFHKITNVGKVLDPIADKLLQMSILLCVAAKRPILFGVVVFVLIKDMLLGIGAIVLYKSGNIVSQAKWCGKIGSFVSFVSSLVLIFPKTVPLSDVWVYVLAGAVILANTAAFVGYVIEYIKQRRVIKTKPG